MKTKTSIVPALALFALAFGPTACGDKGASEPKASASVDPALVGLPAASDELLIPNYSATVSGDRLSPGTGGEIKLPGQTVSIKSLTTVKSVIDPNTRQEARASKGERLVIVDLGWAKDSRYAYDAPAVQVLVKDNGSRVNVYDDATATRPFLVSASNNAELVLAVDGHDVTASLVTGKRNADPVTEVLYRAGLKQDVAKPLTFETVKLSDEKGWEATYSTTVESAEISPYLPAFLAGGTGKWASPGRAFLLLGVSGHKAIIQHGFISWSIEKTSQTWTVKVGDDSITTELNPVFDSATDGKTLTSAFDVPAKTRSVGLSVAAISVADLKGDIRELDHGTQTFEVKFG